MLGELVAPEARQARGGFLVRESGIAGRRQMGLLELRDGGRSLDLFRRRSSGLFRRSSSFDIVGRRRRHVSIDTTQKGIGERAREKRERRGSKREIVKKNSFVLRFCFLLIFFMTKKKLNLNNFFPTWPTRASPPPGTASPSSCPATCPSPCRPGTASPCPAGPRAARPRRAPPARCPCRRRPTLSRP